MNEVSHRGSEEARNYLPSLIEAAANGRATIITPPRPPVAALLPLAAYQNHHRQQSLLPLEGSGRGQRGSNSGRTLRKLRDDKEPVGSRGAAIGRPAADGFGADHRSF